MSNPDGSVRTAEDIAWTNACKSGDSKRICDILDTAWGKKMLNDGLKSMMERDMKLTEKQFAKKHGLEGKWY